MFRTPLNPSSTKYPISIKSKILAIGSCFAEFIGDQLVKNKFQIISNPFGVIYHPLAQYQLLELVLKKKMPPDDSYVQHQGIWYNYFFHGSFSETTKLKLEHRIEQKLEEVNGHLVGLDYLLLTFGTAIQYLHQETGLIVANCHKVPQREFVKQLTSGEIIVNQLQQLLSNATHFNPKIILSVSPIRHLSEGLENNCVSKSTLRVACEHLNQAEGRVSYFPGYEIMLDDLRDYRFYEKDMIHPNETAREYIWDIFIKNYLDEQAIKFVKEWSKISKSLNHRAFHPNSSAHQNFIRETLKKIGQLPDFIDTKAEVAQLKKHLI